MIVAVTGALVALVAVKAAILPVPDAARPILMLLLVQLNTVPGTGPVKLIAAVAALLQTAWLVGWSIVGAGLTVIVKVTGVPTQATPPLVNVGVTTIVPVMGAVVVLVATKFKLPVPAAGRPIAGLEFVQA